MCFRPNEVSVIEKPAICPTCGMENAPGEVQCLFCGASIPQEELASSPAPAAPKAPHAPAAPAAPKGPSML